MTTEDISRRLAGQSVSGVTEAADGSITIAFTDGSSLRASATDDGRVRLRIESKPKPRSAPGTRVPSARQREYLEFIARYMARYGVSPAESDIQRHFMVSAPSVNQMMKTLERLGFIARARDFTGQAVPRSIRVLVDGDGAPVSDTARPAPHASDSARIVQTIWKRMLRDS